MKKVLKIGALVLALCLIGGILYLTSLFAGTPWGWVSAYIQWQEVIKQHEGEEYHIDGIGYDFKFAVYYAKLTTPAHIDGDFTVYVRRDKVYDTYEERVLGRANTASRINEEYNESVDKLIQEFSEIYHFDRSHGLNCIKFLDGSYGYRYEETDAIFPNAVKQTDLVLDKKYDVFEMARTNGYIHLELHVEECSFEWAAETLLNFKRMADEKGISFYAVDFKLFEKLEEGEHSWKEGEWIVVPSFLYSDIYEEGLAERIEAAHNAEVARIEEMLNKKENEIS